MQWARCSQEKNIYVVYHPESHKRKERSEYMQQQEVEDKNRKTQENREQRDNDAASSCKCRGLTWLVVQLNVRTGRTDEDQLVVHSREWTGERERWIRRRETVLARVAMAKMDYGLFVVRCVRVPGRAAASGYSIRCSRKTRGR